jgi:hypothetical protein
MMKHIEPEAESCFIWFIYLGGEGWGGYLPTLHE